MAMRASATPSRNQSVTEVSSVSSILLPFTGESPGTQDTVAGMMLFVAGEGND
jgi:hypothetical protein